MKMKNVIVFLMMLLAPVVTSGQKIEKDSVSGIYTAKGVVQVDDVPKDKLYSRAMEWIALSYKSAQDVVQLSNKEDGKIICKGNFPVSLYMKSGSVEHTLTLEFKDNRFRYRYTNFVYYSAGSGSVPFDGTMMGKKKAISTTEEKIEKSISSLTAYLKGNDKAADDGW